MKKNRWGNLRLKSCEKISNNKYRLIVHDETRDIETEWHFNYKTKILSFQNKGEGISQRVKNAAKLFLEDTQSTWQAECLEQK